MEERLDITFTIVELEQNRVISAKPMEYRSLMHLIKDKLYTDEFGHCGGMGRCGTCSIQLKNKKHALSDFNRNELITLKKNGHSDFSTRLSCQIEINNALDNEVIHLVP